MQYFARCFKDKEGNIRFQSVEDHCRETAEIAKEKSLDCLQNTAYLAGLLHDLGKYTKVFQDYISDIAHDIPVKKGSVTHTFAGVKHILDAQHTESNAYDTDKNATAELIALGAGSHHYPFDAIGPCRYNGYQHRQSSKVEIYNESQKNFLKLCATEKELNKLFLAAEKETTNLLNACHNLRVETNLKDSYGFYNGLSARMLKSAVIDGDRLSAAGFDYGKGFYHKEDTQKVWEKTSKDIERYIKTTFLSDKEKANLPINKAKDYISDECLKSAKKKPGIYKLTAPTGGGKTIAGLRFAVNHARIHGKKRIIFVIPFLKVLDQNAKSFRTVIDDNNIILEHHSNIVVENTEYNESFQSFNRSQFLIDTWDQPIIITTFVQFMNTLFAGKASCIRRMNALQDSVIIIDEVQSVPVKMLSLFTLAINFLANICGATIVFASATQPSLETLPAPVLYNQDSELVPYNKELYKVFKRTEIIDKRKLGGDQAGYTIPELADFSISCMEEQGNNLTICNTRSQAKSLYLEIKNKVSADVKVIHISTNMCMHHRLATFAFLEDSLSKDEKVICVSTSLIEAGVDISFSSIIRVITGLDRIQQSAGRANRFGEKDRPCPVYLVNIYKENLSMLKTIQAEKKAAEDILNSFGKNSQLYGKSLASDEAMKGYYRLFYANEADNSFDYTLTIGQTTTSIFKLLSTNDSYKNLLKLDERNKYFFTQAFKTAGDAFQVYDNSTIDVVVPYNNRGKSLLKQLERAYAENNFNGQKKLINQLSEYSISLFQWQYKALEKQNGYNFILDNKIIILKDDFYSQKCGLTLPETGKDDKE